MLTIFYWLEKAVGVNPYACIRFAAQPAISYSLIASAAVG